MIIYLVNIIQIFLPAAIASGMILALWKYMDEKQMTKHVLFALIAGLFCGGVLYGLTPERFSVISIRTYLGIITSSSALLSVSALWLSSKRNGIVQTVAWATSLMFVATLSSAASFSFILFASDRTLSSIPVMNTGAILNISGILSGLTVIILLIILITHMGRNAGKGITLSLFTVAALLFILTSGSDAVLGLMRAEIIELTSKRLTFAAKVTNLSSMLSYALVVLIGSLFLTSFYKRPSLAPGHETLNSAGKRKALSDVLKERKWLKAAAVTITVVLSTMLYYDLYASRPPEISTPVRLTPDADGLITVKIDDVKDGSLHRFSYITEDGYAIRFFMINLYENRTKIGVVFDACVMCGGEKGYIQKGNEIICLACNVRIFLPSIGKSGGCNPIPLNHEIKNGDIIISVDELETEKDYFPQTVQAGAETITGKEQTWTAKIYRGFRIFTSAFSNLTKQEEEPGQCHFDLASVEGGNH